MDKERGREREWKRKSGGEKGDLSAQPIYHWGQTVAFVLFSWLAKTSCGKQVFKWHIVMCYTVFFYHLLLLRRAKSKSSKTAGFFFQKVSDFKDWNATLTSFMNKTLPSAEGVWTLNNLIRAFVVEFLTKLQWKTCWNYWFSSFFYSENQEVIWKKLNFTP